MRSKRAQQPRQLGFEPIKIDDFIVFKHETWWFYGILAPKPIV
jgi:hypothetical protein